MDISNTFFCGTGLDLKTNNFSSIDATGCYFDGGSPSTSGSNIQHYDDQSCGLAKVSFDQQTENHNNMTSANGDIVRSEFGKINSAYFSLNKKLINAFKNKEAIDKEAYCTDYEKVIADFKEFIKNNPDSPLAKIALIASAKSYRRTDDLRGISNFIDMKDFLTGIIADNEYSSLKPHAERLMIDYYGKAKDFTSAIETADNLIEKYENDPDYLCSVMYAKGLILEHSLNDSKRAENLDKQFSSEW